MIKPPTKLRIYSPVMLANIDFTAEPELEGKTGSAYRGVAIADGGHAINAADGFPGRVLTIDQAPNADLFNIEYAMTLIKKINSVILDGHNLLSVYAASLRDSFKIKHSATDVLGVLVENEIRYSGLLGKERPFQRYNGVDAHTTHDGVSVTEYPFTMVSKFTTTDAPGTLFELEDKSTSNVYFGLGIDGDGLPIIVARNTSQILGAGSTAVNDGIEHIMTGVFLSATERELFIDGVSVATSTTSVAMNAGVDRISMGRSGRSTPVNYIATDESENILYNRALAPKEIEQMALGVPVPKPLILGHLSDFTLWASDDPVGWAVSGEAGSDPEISEVGQGEGHGGSGKGYCNIFSTSSVVQMDLVIAVIPGNRHTLSLDIDTVISGGLSVSEITSGDFPATDYTTTGDKEINFIPTTSTITVRLKRGAQPCDVTFKNVYLTDLDVKATFPLLADQDGIRGVVAGSFVVDDQYRIATTGTTDFTLIGAADSNPGTVFTATGAGAGTGTADRLGAVAAYLPDGISADQAKWLDLSKNNLHGIDTSVESIDAPAGDVRGFVVSQFDEITNHKFWQMVFNEDLDTALLDILIGQVAGCWYRDYEIAAGGFKGRAGFPGVKLGMNESGRDNPEQKFGEKPDWDLTLRVTDDEGINDLEEFVRTVSGSLLPAWITFDPPTTNNPVQEPVFERVTLIESVFPWEFKFGQTLPWQVGLKFSRRLD